MGRGRGPLQGATTSPDAECCPGSTAGLTPSVGGTLSTGIPLPTPCPRSVSVNIKALSFTFSGSV